MTADEQGTQDEVRQRVEREQQRSRELAAALAERAEEIATTMDRAAGLHESVAETADHPLREGASEHATFEREFAAGERQDAERLRRIAEGGS